MWILYSCVEGPPLAMALVPTCWTLVFLLSLCPTSAQFSIQITPPCKSDQHYEYAGQCCTKCEPGKYMSAKCTATSETVCQPCGPNEYIDIWNEEEKCLLHKICDHGKALIEVNPGNSTSQRQCACTAGYHWNEDCDCCRRNRKCPRGSGVKHPMQQNKDTVCTPCPTGYFSNVSSATDACTMWTNCTALGTEEKMPGNSWADAVCRQHLKPHAQDDSNTLLYIVIASFFLVALVGIVLLVRYYHKKGKTLTDLQYWAHMVCRQIKRTKDSPCDTFVNGNVACPDGPLLLKDTYSFSEDAFDPHGRNVNGEGVPDGIHCESGEDFPIQSLITMSEDDHFRQVPMEDEYMDRISHVPHYLPLLGQAEIKPISCFSEPLEVGENDSLSQCFIGTENVMEFPYCCCSDASCGTDPIQASSHKCLPTTCHHSACRDADMQDISDAVLRSGETSSCTASKASCRESPSKHFCAGNSLEDSSPSPLGTYGLDSPSLGQPDSANNSSFRSDPFDGNGTKRQNAKRIPESNGNTSDAPAASGNVTGNGNSTFISSGQVMNFKGEIIVVYVSQNSQEGSMSPGSSDDSLGSPVQEENLNRCETFAGNAHQYKEKCAEMNSPYSTSSGEPASTLGGFKRTSGPIVQEENLKGQDNKHLYNEAPWPVQEEGKSGQFLKEALN